MIHTQKANDTVQWRCTYDKNRARTELEGLSAELRVDGKTCCCVYAVGYIERRWSPYSLRAYPYNMHCVVV